MLNILLGLFFIVHGLIHLSFISPAPPASPGGPAWPFSLTHSWLGLGENLLVSIGTVLVLVAAIGFVIVGLGTLGWLVPTLWIKPVAIVAAVASLLLMIIFWNTWYIVGLGLSVAILLWYVIK